MADLPLESEMHARLPNGSVVCRPAGVQYQSVPVTVPGSAMEGAMVLAVNNGVRRRLVEDQEGPSSRSLVSPMLLADLNPSCVQLVETRPPSADAFRGPSRCVTPMIVELPPVEVVEQVAVTTVTAPPLAAEPVNIPGVSSR